MDVRNIFLDMNRCFLTFLFKRCLHDFGFEWTNFLVISRLIKRLVVQLSQLKRKTKQNQQRNKILEHSQYLRYNCKKRSFNRDVQSHIAICVCPKGSLSTRFILSTGLLRLIKINMTCNNRCDWKFYSIVKYGIHPRKVNIEKKF